MSWTCKHCQTEIEEKYDYCHHCEECGCTQSNHNCNKEEQDDIH